MSTTMVVARQGAIRTPIMIVLPLAVMAPSRLVKSVMEIVLLHAMMPIAVPLIALSAALIPAVLLAVTPSLVFAARQTVVAPRVVIF